MSKEEWRPVLGYEGIYEASSFGRIRSVERRANTLKGTRRVRERIMKQKTLPVKNYLLVNLSKDGRVSTCAVHVLVLEAFIGKRPSDSYEACHGDGNPQNNYPSNLRWGTASENAQDKLKHGTYGAGEDGSGAKLTQIQVDEIRARIATGMKQRRLSEIFGVSPATICLINKSKTWKEGTYV